MSVKRIWMESHWEAMRFNPNIPISQYPNTFAHTFAIETRTHKWDREHILLIENTLISLGSHRNTHTHMRWHGTTPSKHARTHGTTPSKHARTTGMASQHAPCARTHTWDRNTHTHMGWHRNTHTHLAHSLATECRIAEFVLWQHQTLLCQIAVVRRIWEGNIFVVQRLLLISKLQKRLPSRRLFRV